MATKDIITMDLATVLVEARSLQAGRLLLFPDRIEVLTTAGRSTLSGNIATDERQRLWLEAGETGQWSADGLWRRLGDVLALDLCAGPEPMVGHATRDSEQEEALNLCVAALQQGHNIGVMGAPMAALAMMQDCFVQASAPAWYSPFAATHAGLVWPALNHVDDARALGIDVLAYYEGDMAVAARAYSCTDGVIAWLSGSRLEKTLPRLEIATMTSLHAPAGPLGVLACVDWLVEVSPHGESGYQLSQILALDVAAEGYQPRVLWTKAG